MNMIPGGLGPAHDRIRDSKREMALRRLNYEFQALCDRIRNLVFDQTAIARKILHKGVGFLRDRSVSRETRCFEGNKGTKDERGAGLPDGPAAFDETLLLFHS
jgi:hypothetical protein